MARVDIGRRHPYPSPAALSLATILALGASLAADALLVWVGTSRFPSTRGYVHFRFSDYGLLTTIGVLIACAAWPVVTRVSWDPRWLFLRLAVAVTLVLWVPDVYLIVRHQPIRAVAVLIAMHLAIAVVTYNILVRLAPAVEPSIRAEAPQALPGRRRAGPESDQVGTTEPGQAAEHPNGVFATALSLLVAVEFAVGIAVLVSVPTGRPSGWLPMQGKPVYLVHAILGFPIAAGALVYLVRCLGSTRIDRLSGWIGGTGVGVAAVGGVLAVTHPLRLVGLGFMLLGSMTAVFGYLLPALDRMTDQTPREDGS
ncbi:MAG: hypothetical protein ABSC41_09090 [Acidimicrobiales bacterium]